MPIVSIIAKPGALPTDRVETLCADWGGTELRWLAPNEAAEFAVAAPPPDFETTRGALVEQLDLNLLPDGARKKSILIADMDSTMINEECIDELAEAAGIGPAIRAVTARAMNGEIDFETALTDRVAHLKDLPEAVIAQVLDTQITLAADGPVLLATMRARGAYCALVSGGFTAFTGPIAAKLGFHENRANTLLAEDGRLTGAVGQPILGRDAKVTALSEIAAQQGTTPADAIAVGDGANDLGMLGAAGLGVALHAKPSVQAQAQLRINAGDLTALLYLQGIAKADFAPAP